MASKSNKIGKIAHLSAITVLVVGFAVFALEKNQVTDFYNKPVPVAQEGARPVNDIAYTPASPADNKDINEQKESGTINEQPPSPQPGSPVNVVLTAVGQDEPGGPVVVKVLLADVKSGECTVKITNGTVTKTYSSQVTSAGTYYNCGNNNIPLADVSPGVWQLTVSVKSGDRAGRADKEIEVNL